MRRRRTGRSRRFRMEAGRFSWHGIVAATAEWIAAEQSPAGQKRSFENAILAYGLNGVFGTGWRETAGGRQQGGKIAFVSLQQANQAKPWPKPRGTALLCLARLNWALREGAGFLLFCIHAQPLCGSKAARACSRAARLFIAKSGRTVITISLACGN